MGRAELTSHFAYRGPMEFFECVAWEKGKGSGTTKDHYIINLWHESERDRGNKERSKKKG